MGQMRDFWASPLFTFFRLGQIRDFRENSAENAIIQPYCGQGGLES